MRYDRSCYKRVCVFKMFVCGFNNFGCPIQLRYKHKCDHRSPLNRTGLRAIKGFVIKIYEQEFYYFLRLACTRQLKSKNYE